MGGKRRPGRENEEKTWSRNIKMRKRPGGENEEKLNLIHFWCWGLWCGSGKEMRITHWLRVVHFVAVLISYWNAESGLIVVISSYCSGLI